MNNLDQPAPADLTGQGELEHDAGPPALEDPEPAGLAGNNALGAHATAAGLSDDGALEPAQLEPAAPLSAGFTVDFEEPELQVCAALLVQLVPAVLPLWWWLHIPYVRALCAIP